MDSAISNDTKLAVARDLLEYYRCPEEYATVSAETPGSSEGSERPDYFRRERYAKDSVKSNATGGMKGLVRNAYYLARPLMPVGIRRHLQRMHLRGWEQIEFPRWPVDRTVEAIVENLLVASLKTHSLSKVPFIWFWPDGHKSCAIMTHDVETESGRDFCSELMDINDRREIKSSFQIVPEKRYAVAPAFLNSIKDRGFEINVHDLNHDGHLFSQYDRFRNRADRINHYGREYGAAGFRAAVLYRNPDWLGALEFSYDMSFPNVAHLDPQRGGCCTIMPFFIGQILELPLTATQDYSLFHVLNDYSLDLWKRQIALVTEKHGLVSFIVHPDYIIENRARKTYENLLDYLALLRSDNQIWVPLPGEVNRWWRQRGKMTLRFESGKWSVHGEGSERARVAYGTLIDGKLQYIFDTAIA